MSEDRMMNVDWEQVDDRARRVTNLEWLQAEVERLTAELAEMKGFEIPLRDARIDELSDIEKALRAITGVMAPHPRVWDDVWSNACAEWDRLAGEVT